MGRGYLIGGMVLGLGLLISGCAGMKELRTENDQLRAEIARLQQIENDYGDKIRGLEAMTAAERRKMRSEMEEMERRLSSSLEEQIEQNEALIRKAKDLTVIEVGEAALFASGEADLTPKGARLVRQMTAVLSRYPGYHIRVEGHTDALPIGKRLKPKFASNWELSTTRATNVIRYMIYGLKMDPVRLQAVGYAQFRPIASNETAAGRAKNRRIRIVVFKSLEADHADRISRTVR